MNRYFIREYIHRCHINIKGAHHHNIVSYWGNANGNHKELPQCHCVLITMSTIKKTDRIRCQQGAQEPNLWAVENTEWHSHFGNSLGNSFNIIKKLNTGIPLLDVYQEARKQMALSGHVQMCRAALLITAEILQITPHPTPKVHQKVTDLKIIMLSNKRSQIKIEYIVWDSFFIKLKIMQTNLQ